MAVGIATGRGVAKASRVGKCKKVLINGVAMALPPSPNSPERKPTTLPISISLMTSKSLILWQYMNVSG
jgi:hypothetical protein